MNIYRTPLAHQVIGCAIEIHSAVGPGLLESIYDRCLAHEFTLQGLSFRQQVPLPIVYKGMPVGLGYRVDFVVEDELVVELKSAERLLAIHDAQVLTYLRQLKLRQGLLINFNVGRLTDGVRSLLNTRASEPDPSEVHGASRPESDEP
jgi:GxxExxY protein